MTVMADTAWVTVKTSDSDADTVPGRAADGVSVRMSTTAHTAAAIPSKTRITTAIRIAASPLRFCLRAKERPAEVQPGPSLAIVTFPTSVSGTGTNDEPVSEMGPYSTDTTTVTGSPTSVAGSSGVIVSV